MKDIDMEAEYDSSALSPRYEYRVNYYRPPVEIREVSGVEIDRTGIHHDAFRGTADALVATGLVTVSMLPGQPGRPRTTVCYRAEGAMSIDAKGARLPVWRRPGYLSIQSYAAGLYYALLVVSPEEQRRREAEAAVEADRERHRAQMTRHEPNQGVGPDGLTLAEAQDTAARHIEYFVRRLGIEFVRDLVNADLRADRTRRHAEHLRLVWSAGSAAT